MEPIDCSLVISVDMDILVFLGGFSSVFEGHCNAFKLSIIDELVLAYILYLYIDFFLVYVIDY